MGLLLRLMGRLSTSAAAGALAAALIVGLAGCGGGSALRQSHRPSGRLEPGAARHGRWIVLEHPIRRWELTDLKWGHRSYWLQPWRSSLTTRSAVDLRGAIGINLDNQVSAKQAPDVLRLLAQSGFARARLEIPWQNMDPSDVAVPAEPQQYTPALAAMRAYHIRPLILVDGAAPSTHVGVTFAAAAPAGVQSVRLSARSVGAVVPGRTHLVGHNLQVLITSVSRDGVAALSRPLRTAVPAGRSFIKVGAVAPFEPPFLANGQPNPGYQTPLANWLQYVKGVCRFVASAYGSTNFDVEIWNEGTPFLQQATFYSTPPDPGATGSVSGELLNATVAMLKDPANGLTGVQIGDGFSNTIPYPSGASVPAGVAALDKHPYPVQWTFPSATPPDGLQSRPVGATGQLAETHVQSVGFYDTFTPSFREFMPEYYLTGIQTETLMRDLSPYTTMIENNPHGAQTRPAPGDAAPTMWVTEDGLNGSEAEAFGLPAADLPEMQAKAALRFYTAYASEGAQAIDLFAANGGPNWNLVSSAFLNAAQADPSSYPSVSGGPVMSAVSRMVSTLAGAQPISSPHQLSLESIASDNNSDVQFVGDGTAVHPNLFNRDVLAFFPFQVSQYKFVSSVYVMSSDLTHRYTNNPAPGMTSYDMPPENFRLTIGNLNGQTANVSLYDPLTGTQQPAGIIARSAHQITVQLQATDSPRMLTITDPPVGN
jgi:hypothetical protein